MGKLPKIGMKQVTQVTRVGADALLTQAADFD